MKNERCVIKFGLETTGIYDVRVIEFIPSRDRMDGVYSSRLLENDNKNVGRFRRRSGADRREITRRSRLKRQAGDKRNNN